MIKEIRYIQKPLKNMLNTYDQLGMVFHFMVITQIIQLLIVWECILIYSNLKFKKKREVENMNGEKEVKNFFRGNNTLLDSDYKKIIRGIY